MPRVTFMNLPEAKRARIVSAAIEEFSGAPYGQATLDRIAKNSSVAKGSLYQYFEGKLDLYRYLLLEVLPSRKMQATVMDAPNKSDGVWAEFEHAFVSGLHFSRQEPQLTRLGIRFLRDYDQLPELRAIAASHREMSHAWVTEILQRGQRQGEISRQLDLRLAAPFVAHSLGEGSIQMIAVILGVSLEEYLEKPELAQSLEAKQIKALISSILDMLRLGLGQRENEG